MANMPANWGVMSDCKHLNDRGTCYYCGAPLQEVSASAERPEPPQEPVRRAVYDMLMSRNFTMLEICEAILRIHQSTNHPGMSSAERQDTELAIKYAGSLRHWDVK